MKTKELNEYIFANLVADKAQYVRRARQRKMDDDGIPSEEVNNTPLTQEDLRVGLMNLGL